MKIIIPILLSLGLTACAKTDPPSAYGTLERDRVTLSATANEIIVARHVAEGSQIKKGDLLLSLDNRLETEKVKQLQAEKDRLEASFEFYKNGNRQEQIASAEARKAQAKAKFVNATQELKRRESLRAQSLISIAELDQARLGYETSKAQLDDAEQQLLELKTGNREEIIRQAEAALKIAEANLAQEEKRLADLQIIATRDGILEDFPYELGERVPLGAVVAIISADSAPYARVSLPENSLTHFKPNQSVDIFLDGIEQPIKGNIRYISPRPFFTPYFALHPSERSRLMYKVEIDLPAANSLPTGLPLRLELK
jgi:HlyD family secretion protein